MLSVLAESASVYLSVRVNVTESLTSTSVGIRTAGVAENLTSRSVGIRRVNVSEAFGVRAQNVSRSVTVSESLEARQLPFFEICIGISESLESIRNVSLSQHAYVIVSETLESKLDAVRAYVYLSETLTREKENNTIIVLVSESLDIVYNATPTRTPTITPPPPTQTFTPIPTPVVTPPALWQDRILCNEVSPSSCQYLGNQLYLCEIDGNPYIEVSGVHTKELVAITLQPSPSVGTQYPLVCANYWYCGFRVWAGINCVYGRCGVMINPLSGVELPSNLLRQYAVVDNLKVYIRAREESGVFGYGIITYYLVIKYTTTDGFESGEIETVIWSWTYGGSVETKEPYPILVSIRNTDKVYNCGKLELMLCPWRGAWHSLVSCAIFDLIRYMWNFIYSIIPQPVKDFMSLIYAFLSGVTAVLSLALNPTFITMFTILIFSVFALFLVYLLLEKGPIGIIEFFATVKEFVGSVVDWILKLINTLKP